MNNVMRMLVLGCALAALAACAPAPKKTDAKGEDRPIVFPEPPDDPRFVFERAIYSSADVVPEDDTEAMRRRLTGENKAGEPLGKPYSVAVKGGKVYVSDSVEGAVKVFDIPRGRFQRIGQDSTGGGQLGQPLGHEAVVLDWSDVKLIGIPKEKGEWPVIDGEGTRSDGVIASGNNFEMAFFAVKNYTSNGVLVEGSTGVYLHDLYIENTGVYGVYPVRCTDVLMERIEGTLLNDAAIYAGKSANVVIRDTLTYGNVIGISWRTRLTAKCITTWRTTTLWASSLICCRNYLQRFR